MKLTVGERLIICGILPKESTFITLRIIRTLVGRLGISAEEMKEFEVTEENGTVTWNALGNEGVEFEFADVELDLIRQQLKKLDAEGKLTNDLFTLYEKFC